MVAMKILVVEDEGLTAMEIQRKLKNWGYDVPSFAFSRKEAVKKAKEIEPDLILMDIMLKGKGDGIDAAQEIKQIRDIPIIYLTAYDDAKTRKRAEITNPNAYLIKPFEERELQSKIQTALSEHKLGKKLLSIGKRLDNKSKNSGIILINHNGCISYINSFASDLTGFMQQEAMNKELNEVFPIEGIENKDLKSYIKSIISDNTTITAESILQDKEGKNVYVEYKIAQTIDEENGILGVELIFEDISQEVKDGKSLMEREKKFRGIYYQSMLATEIFDGEGKLLDANPACLHLFGAEDANQLEKFNLFEDFKLNPEEVENLKNGLEVKFECEFDGEELSELGFHKKVNKGAIYLSLFITPLKIDESVSGYLVQFQDVTPHRKLEASLKSNEERYLKILNTLDQAVIAFNDDLKCIYCNDMVNDFFDVETGDMIGKSFQESMNSFWDEKLEHMCLETLKSGNTASMIKILQKDGILTHVEIKPYKSFEGLIILLNDVTGIKQTEEELKRNETLYRSVVDDQSEIICRFNKDFELTFANEAYYHYFGLDDESNHLFSLPDEDMEKMKVQFKTFDAENPIKVLEGPIKIPDGVIRWWQWVTRANFDEDGDISEYQSVGRDITLHHEAMEELQKNMEKLQFLVEEKSNKLNVLKESFELEKAEHKQEISSMEKLSDDMVKKYNEETQKLIETIDSHVKELESFKEREKTFKDSLKLAKKDLESKTIEAADSSRALDVEITAHKKTEESLDKTSLDLEEQRAKTNAALSQISNLEKEITGKEAELSTIQSDFQNKISELKQEERTIQESLENREKTLKNVYDGVKTNMQMISTLNRLHSEYVTDQMVKKLEDGRSYLRSFGMVHEKLYQSEDLETVDLGQYLENILDDILRSHGAKNVDIKTETNGIYLNMEKTVLSGLIITELVINSLKHAFTDESVGEIKVEVDRVHDDLIIKVSDNGVGIPPQISVETEDSFGLQLVRTFVKQSEGLMEFKCDNGAEFIIKIPIQED